MSAAITRIKVFLSHSSVDKPLALRLSKDLQAAGLDVWLDQWEIQVGEQFVQTIDKGLDEATYVIVLLTAASVASHWVDREWRQKIQSEVVTKRISILPVRGEPCVVPDFLAQRSYAEISGGSYPLGFRYLLNMISYYSNGAALKLPESLSLPEEEGDERLSSFATIPVVRPIVLEVGAALCSLFEPDHHGRSLALDECAPRMHHALQTDFGFPFPGINIRAVADAMPPWAVLIMIDEIPEFSFEVDQGRVLVEASIESLADLGLQAEATAHPTTGQPCSWIDAADLPTVAAADYRVWQTDAYIFLVLEALLRRMAAQFLTIDVVRGVVGNIELIDPDLVARVVPQFLSWTQLTQVLQCLIEEGICIGAMAAILEALSRCDTDLFSIGMLAEKARHALARQITLQFSRGRDVLPVITLDAAIEDLFSNAIQHRSAAEYLDLDPQVIQLILSSIRTQITSLGITASQPVLLTRWPIRRYIRKMVELEFPWLHVLSRQDLEPDLPFQILAEVRLASSCTDPALARRQPAR
jgi:type III secretory pathway component EscV